MKFRKAPGHFIVVDRTMIDDDTEISYKAKGILTYLMGRPETWKPNLEEIASHASDKIGSIKSGIQELKQAGYVKITRIRDNESKKWVGWEWYVTDVKSQEALPIIEKPKAKNQLTESKPKVENKLSETSPQNQAKLGKTESQKTDLRKNDFVKEIDNSKKELEAKRREREEEEKTTRANSPQVEIYREVFGESNLKRLTILQQQQLTMLDDLDLLRKTCEWWAGNGYQAKSVGSICERYHEQEERIKEKSKPRQCQQESVFDRNLRFLGIDPASLQSIQ